MCETISKNLGMLQFIPNCYKTQEMCKNAVDYYPHAFENVPDC